MSSSSSSAHPPFIQHANRSLSDAPSSVSTTRSLASSSSASAGNAPPPALLSRNSSERPGTPQSDPAFDALKPVDQVETLLRNLAIEDKIKDGAENMLQVLETDPASDRSDLKREVEGELSAANGRIAVLRQQLEGLRDHPDLPRALRKRAFPLQSSLASSSISSSAHAPLSSFTPLVLPTSSRRLPSSTSLLNSSSSSVRRPASPESDFHDALAAASSLLGDLASAGDREAAQIETGNALVDLLKKNASVRFELSARDDIVEIIWEMLAEKQPKDVRATGYRILRHLLLDAQSWRRLEDAGIEWYIFRTFTRDPRHSLEKAQALKLLRWVINLGVLSPSTSTAPGTVAGGPPKIPLCDGIVRTLVSVAENGDDSFRLICLETLAEIAILDVSVLLRNNALRVLLQTFSEGPHELAPVITPVLLHIVDLPETRQGLRPGMDLEMALSGFTDIYGHGESYINRLRSSSKAVSMMLKSWSGILYLCMDDRQGISALVNCLRVPTTQMREVLLDMLFDIFRIKTPPWYLAFLDGKRLTLYSKNVKGTEILRGEDDADDEQDQLTIVHHFTAFLLAVFVDAGLVDALIDMVEEASDMLSRKATLLVGEVLALANKILPSPSAARLQALPRLFSQTAKFTQDRGKASSALSSIDSLHRNRSRLHTPHASAKDIRKRSNSASQDTLVQRQVDSVKVRMGVQMEEKTFQSLLNDTQVLLTRDHTKWNYDILLEVVQGPLLNPRRLEEALKASKFGRRLLSFFHPLNFRFSDIKRTKPNTRWIKLGCAVLTTLLANPDGIAFLIADKFLAQLADCFAELDHYHGTINSDPFLSKRRLDDTLTFGYFEMLGALSQHPEGVNLLSRFRFFTLFYHLSDLRSREDLIKAIIENLDYTADGHSRIVLSKALTSSYMHIRLYATQHLGRLVLTSPETNQWTLQLLTTQLYDPSSEVAELAVHFLEDACDDLEALEIVVAMRPYLDHLGEIGHPLLLRFLSTAVGFSYLRQVDYVDQEMEFWLHDRNLLYVVQVELYLSQVLFPSPSDDKDDLLIFDGTAPPHFYGELTRTEEGCHMLREKGHFIEFAEFVRQHGLEASDVDIINKLKSILWAVGHIGSTEGGFLFLEEADILETIVEIAETSAILSIRGTAFYVLGLISTTVTGTDYLNEFGWEAVLGPSGVPTGLCLPVEISKFTRIEPWVGKDATTPASLDLSPSIIPLEHTIILAIGNLSNHVQANAAFRSLARLKKNHRRAFTSISLFYRALHTVSTNHHRLPIRRFIFDLFDVKLSPQTVAQLMQASTTLRARSPINGDSSAPPVSAADQGDVPLAQASSRRRKGSKQQFSAFSSGEDDLQGGSDEEAESEEEAVQPAVFCQPQSKVVGFVF